LELCEFLHELLRGFQDNDISTFYMIAS